MPEQLSTCVLVLGLLAWAGAIATGLFVHLKSRTPTPSASAPPPTAPSPGATLEEWIAHMEELAQQILDAAKALPGLYAAKQAAAVAAAVASAEADHTTQLQNIKAAIDADTADAQPAA